MPRLFVAIGLPSAAATVLARIRPPALPGIRPIAPEQMHLTLHFLGETDLARAAVALGAVHAPAFALSIAGVGQFCADGRAVTLWAGVAATPALTALHASIGAALERAGFAPERRRYTPHITLARCKPAAPPRTIRHFLESHAALALPVGRVTEFGLYSSTPGPHGPLYRREQRFALQPP